MKAPVGLLSGRAVCVSRWRGVAPTSSAERSKRIFTGGVVEGNGSCRACFLQKQPHGGHPLSLLTAFAASSPKGTPLGYAGNFIATVEAVPLRDDFPRSGGRCRVATKGGVWIDAKRQDGRGNSRALLQASNAKAARPGGLAAFMLIKIFYSTSSSAKIHSTSLMWEPLRE